MRKGHGPLLTGLAAGAMVAGAEGLGLLHPLELRTIDWRYRQVRSTSQPLSDEVRLVGIDDASLDSVGRWPWPRATLALAIEELARAGAGTVALDLLLGEVETPGEGASESAEAALARALGPVRGVLGIHMEVAEGLGSVWETPQGAAALERLLSLLRTQMDVPAEDIAQAAELDEPQRARFLARPLEFKAHAAWLLAEELRAQAGGLPPLDGFLRIATGGRNPASFEGRGAAIRAWERAQSWAHLADEHRVAPAGGGHRDAPPVAELAAVADGAGFVTSDTYDADGAKRRTRPLWRSPAGDALQFGLAAAAAHLDIPPESLVIDEDILRVGEAAIPLGKGGLVLDWPSSTFDGFPSFGAEASQLRPAISIAWLVSMARERVKLEGYEAERRRLFAGIAPSIGAQEGDIDDAARYAAAKSRMDDLVFELDESDPAQAERGRAINELMQLESIVAEGRVVVARGQDALRKAVEGKLVFVGWTATGALADQVQTPYGPRTPGVFVHAVVADMVLGRHARRAADDAATWLSLAAMALLASLAGARLGAVGSFVTVLILIAGYLWAAGILAFDFMHVVYPLVAPASAAGASWIAATAASAVVAARERARVTRQFQARVPPALVDRLAEDPSALSVGGQSREITVLFGDLAGFTAIAEKLGGPEVVSTLNRYLGRLTEELVARRAYVNKFLGDGIMAFWSAFGEEPDQARLACEAARACQKAVRELSERGAADAPKIRVRLGIATGVAVVGDCGAPPNLNDYTAIGDVVNLSSRLESANKQFGTGILVDGRTKQAAGDGLRTRALGSVVVVGQTVPVEVFEVVDESASDESLAASGEAVAQYRAGKPQESAAAWERFVAQHGASKLAEAYLEAIRAGQGADGVLRLRAK